MDLDLSKQLNLSKDVVLDLTKKQGIEGQISKVILCLDYSGSMSNLYRQGTMQKVVQRLVPIAMAFDDDQEMEMYLFHDGVHKLKANVTLNNLEGYVANATKGYNFGGTNYAPAINKITNDFIADNSNVSPQPKKSGGFFSSMFGDKTEKTTVSNIPGYVIFITDGENGDKAQTIKAITEASNHGLFFQFVGLKSGYSSRFEFLNELDNLQGRFIDNANFFEITDNSLVNTSDVPLYTQLLNEYPSWVKEAKRKNIVK